MNPLTIDDLGSIQGDILINGFPKKAEIFCFFTIRAAQAFCQNIQKVNIATGKDIKDLRRDISQLADGKIIDVAKTNIAFTSTGLTKVGISAEVTYCELTKIAGQLPEHTREWS